jgi:hypothetical protein
MRGGVIHRRSTGNAEWALAGKADFSLRLSEG